MFHYCKALLARYSLLKAHNKTPLVNFVNSIIDAALRFTVRSYKTFNKELVDLGSDTEGAKTEATTFNSEHLNYRC